MIRERTEAHAIATLTTFFELAIRRPHKMMGAHLAIWSRSGHVRGGEADVLNRAARQPESLDERAEIEIVLPEHLARQRLLPQLLTHLLVGHRELEHEPDAS